MVRCFKRKPASSDPTVGGEATRHAVVVEEEEHAANPDEESRTNSEDLEGPCANDSDSIRRCLFDWMRSVQCAGLLKGDEKAAQTILNPSGDNDNTKSSPHFSVDAQHVLSAISRILEGGLTNVETSLVPVAADLLAAICEYIKRCPSPDDACFRAESELIAKAAKPLLRSLLLHVDSFHKSVVNAATGILSLMGPKLSRSTELLNGWHDAIIFTCDGRISATLIASLVFVGGKQIKPSDLFSQTLAEYHYAIRLWIESVVSFDWEPRKRFAIAEPSSIAQAKEELRVLGICQIVKNEWLPKIKAASSEAEKIEFFESRLAFMVDVVASLLRRDAVGDAASAVPMLQQQLTTRALVDLRLVEDLLIDYRAAARSLASRTKKRLRSLATPSGVVSISSTLSEVDTVQRTGHRLLDLYVSTIGVSGLLPFSKRLERLSSEAMWLSTSTVVQNALEPTLQAKVRRDFHMPLRISSIQSYRNLINCFGRPPSTNRDKNNKVNRAIAVVCATAVELLTTRQAPVVELSDCVELLMISLQTLQTCLDCGGENLIYTVRNLVDSVGYTCFKAIHGRTRHPLLCYSGVRLATIRLASSMLCVPHQDGSAPNYELRRSILLAAQVLKHDQDNMVASGAATLLQVNNAISSPRRPTLHIVVKHAHDEKMEQSRGTLEGPSAALEEKILVASANLDSAEVEHEQRRIERERADKTKEKSLENEEAEPRYLSVLFPPDDNNKLVHEAQNNEATEADNSVDKSSQTIKSDPKAQVERLNGQAKDDEEADDEMPMIVDCGPDEEDEE